MTTAAKDTIAALGALVDRLRPAAGPEEAESRVLAEARRLAAHPQEAAALRAGLEALLALPRQASLYAEAGIRSALGLWLELTQRLRHHLLPPVPDDASLESILGRVFPQPRDHEWVAAVPDAAWLALAEALGWTGAPGGLVANLLEAARLLSYRLAGASLDRELLRAEPALESQASPFLAQNAALLPALERAAAGGPAPTAREAAAVGLLLDQCAAALEQVGHQALTKGISIRLTYQLARLGQLIGRLRLLLDAVTAQGAEAGARRVALMKTLVAGEQARHRVWRFLSDDLSLLARKITDHASRHGEHYIAETRREWAAMALAAAGGGVVIAAMALVKLRLALLHLPPLTEGLAFGLNYSLGFTLIHLLGCVVATKQPAMTASALAATLEEAHPHDLQRLAELVGNVARTQFVAVLGNVGLAVPTAILLAMAWARVGGEALVPGAKALSLMGEVHPLATGALGFAAVAGVGLCLSGLVSGYFDNRASYHGLRARVAAAPGLRWLGARRAARLGEYLDEHFGAILGNVFFGLFLGLVGALPALTGLPVDIRHVAFSAANLGTALVVLDGPALRQGLPWAVTGVAAIALVNLLVSFTLALHLALKARRLGAGPILELGALLLRRFARRPWSFFTPPPA